MVAHAEKAAEREHPVGDATRGDVEHDRCDLAEILAAAIGDRVADQRTGIHHLRARAIYDAQPYWDDAQHRRDPRSADRDDVY